MPLTLITSLPAFDSQDALDSTPNSFSDIPAVLKHQEKDIQVTLEPPLEGYQSAIRGTLYILTSTLVFMPDSGSSGFQIDYPAITLHAISRGESGPSIYCQLDEAFGDASPKSNETGDEDTQMRELIIIPQHPGSVEKIFEALSECASLHPDPEVEDAQGDAFIDESAFETFNGSEEEELSEVGRAALEHMESIMHDPHHLLPNDEDNSEVTEIEGGSEETTNETASRDRM